MQTRFGQGKEENLGYLKQTRFGQAKRENLGHLKYKQDLGRPREKI